MVMSLPVEGAVAEQLLALQTPVVLLGSRHEKLDAYWWDDQEGARLATEYLAEHGHRRIGLITAQPWSYSAAPRLEGYKAALEAAGLSYDPELVVAGQTTKHAGYSEEAGAEGMEALLSLDDPPTAVFAASDVQAFGAWAFARDRGMVVPRDISIVGYDDIKMSRFLDLTTVTQQMQKAGTLATERLLARLEAGPDVETIDVELPLSLAVRGSTAPLA